MIKIIANKASYAAERMNELYKLRTQIARVQALIYNLRHPLEKDEYALWKSLVADMIEEALGGD